MIVMRKEVYLLSLLSLINICSTEISNAQQERSLDHIRFIPKRVLFQFNGSFYPHTLLFNPYYYYTFKMGFLDYNQLDSIQYLIFEQPKVAQNKNYIVEYDKYYCTIDTLDSYFPLIKSVPRSDSIDTYLYSKYRLLPMYPKLDTLYNLLTEVNYSYLLTLMGEPPLSISNHKKVLRIIYFDDIYHSVNSYCSIRINIDNDSSKIFYTRLIFEEMINPIFAQKNSKLLKSRDVKTLLKILSRIDTRTEGIDCLPYGKEYLLEYIENSEYYIFLRGDEYSCEKHIESLSPFLSLEMFLKMMSKKYFN